MRTLKSANLHSVAELDNLWCAWEAYAQPRHRQPRISAFSLDADRQLIRLQSQLLSGRFQPETWKIRLIADPKVRLIAAPSVLERVLHRAILQQIAPFYEARFIHHSYTGRSGRGMHRALLQCQHWMRRHRYLGHCDIHHYFASIPVALLGSLLCSSLRDAPLQTLIQQLLNSGSQVYQRAHSQGLADRAGLQRTRPGIGLPLGSSLSQWCGNFYLDGLDQFVKRTLKLPGYLRYMDDFVLFGQDQQQVADAIDAVQQWLQNERALTLKPTSGSVVTSMEPLLFLGHRVSRSGISPGRKLRRRLKGKLRTSAQQGPDHLQRTLQSYRGLLLF